MASESQDHYHIECGDIIEVPISSEEIIIPTLITRNTEADTEEYVESDTLSDEITDNHFIPTDVVSPRELFQSRKKHVKEDALSKLTKELFDKSSNSTNEDSDGTLDDSNQPMEEQQPEQPDLVINNDPVPLTSIDDLHENLCRICLTSTELVSLLKEVDHQSIAALLMTICPNVRVLAKDPLPQCICQPCLDRLITATQFKQQCEATEKHLRQLLSESRKRLKRTISVPEKVEVEEKTYPEKSYPTSSSDDFFDDSNDSDYGSQKRKPSKTSGRKRKRRRNTNSNAASRKATATRAKKSLDPQEEEFIPKIIFDDEDIAENCPENEEKYAKHFEYKTGYECADCHQVFKRESSLKLHRKVHEVRESFKCHICRKEFKVKGAYQTHLERHEKEEIGHNCNKCSLIFPTKAELRRHLTDDHDDEGSFYECNRCKKTFVSMIRLEKHQNQHCVGLLEQLSKQKAKKEMESLITGENLFKTVAPLTTTYWSDSFSD